MINFLRVDLRIIRFVNFNPGFGLFRIGFLMGLILINLGVNLIGEVF